MISLIVPETRSNGEDLRGRLIPVHVTITQDANDTAERSVTQLQPTRVMAGLLTTEITVTARYVPEATYVDAVLEGIDALPALAAVYPLYDWHVQEVTGCFHTPDRDPISRRAPERGPEYTEVFFDVMLTGFEKRVPNPREIDCG